MSIVCTPDQLQLVYSATGPNHTTGIIDPTPYRFESPLEGVTLSNQNGRDTYGMHPLLLARQTSGVPISTPFGIIVTIRMKGGQKQPKDYDRSSLHNLITANNPCPVHCVREKFRFSMDLSRYWQEDIEAPACSEYPLNYAFANFFWWHMPPGNLLVTIGTSNLPPMIAAYCGLKVIAIDGCMGESTPDWATQLNKNLADVMFMRAPEQARCNTHRKTHMPIRKTNTHAYLDSVLTLFLLCV